MANKQLFKSALPGPAIPPADTHNEAGGIAYSRSDKAHLAQLSSTGCLNSTFYVSGEDQLKRVLGLVQTVDPVFTAQCAIYSRERGYMKDMPALLAAALFARVKEANERATQATVAAKQPGASPALLEARDAAASEAYRARTAFVAAFGRTMDNAKMLRNFVQIIRSGVVGRKAIASSMMKKLIQQWFDGHTDEQLFRSSVGNDPSLLDIIKLGRVNARTASRRALFKWLADAEVGKADRRGFDYRPADLPTLVRDFEAWKKDKSLPTPRVRFEMLTAQELTSAQWTDIARNASWDQTRRNLNTFSRHGVFGDERVKRAIVDRIQSPELIRNSGIFPYALMTSYNYVSADVPMDVKVALQRALDISMENVPAIAGRVVVCPDVSGSMGSPVTGNRDSSATGITARRGRPNGATTVVTCREVASLVSAALLRKDPNTMILPFNDRVHTVHLNPLDSLATNATKLAALPQGGTNCSLPLVHLNALQAKADVVIYISDYESWIDSQGKSLHASTYASASRVSTGVMEEWAKFKARNPKAKLVLIDLTPAPSTQTIQREDILLVGGFSDQVFKLISAFVEHGVGEDYWVREIESICLTEQSRMAASEESDGGEASP